MTSMTDTRSIIISLSHRLEREGKNMFMPVSVVFDIDQIPCPLIANKHPLFTKQ